MTEFVSLFQLVISNIYQPLPAWVPNHQMWCSCRYRRLPALFASSIFSTNRLT